MPDLLNVIFIPLLRVQFPASLSRHLATFAILNESEKKQVIRDARIILSCKVGARDIQETAGDMELPLDNLLPNFTTQSPATLVKYRQQQPHKAW